LYPQIATTSFDWRRRVVRARCWVVGGARDEGGPFFNIDSNVEVGVDAPLVSHQNIIKKPSPVNHHACGLRMIRRLQ